MNDNKDYVREFLYGTSSLQFDQGETKLSICMNERMEKLVFFGRGDRVRGRAGSRLLFWASGGAAAVKEDGGLDMVASASGQWFGVQELTEQMKTSLLPKELMDRALSFAKADC